MIFKSRTKPKELEILEILNNRMDLPKQEKQHYHSLKKGYEGELMFDSLTEKLQCECYILNDLLLQIYNTTFQIDTLIILQGKIVLIDVKTFEGEHFFEGDKLYKKPRFEILNPFDQLSRCESLLKHLLLSLGTKLPIESHVVFVHPSFTLYQAPLDKPIIFPNQVKSFLSNLNATPSKLSERHKKLANQLVSLHITDFPYSKIPKFDYDTLKKGINCNNCKSFLKIVKRTCICPKCGHAEPMRKAVLRAVKEFQILFPDEKITTNKIHDWCRIIPSKRTIRRILAANYKAVGVRQWTYYV